MQPPTPMEDGRKPRPDFCNQCYIPLQRLDQGAHKTHVTRPTALFKINPGAIICRVHAGRPKSKIRKITCPTRPRARKQAVISLQD